VDRTFWLAQAEKGFAVGHGDTELFTVKRREDAELIVHAVNSHETLLEALKEVMTTLVGVREGEPLYKIEGPLNRAHAAVAKAEGGVK
jgi:hypothetical protein